MPYSSTHHCWQFPSPLYGSKRSVAAKCKTIVSLAIKSGNWGDALMQHDSRNALEDRSALLIGDTRAYVADSPIWRIYCLMSNLNNKFNIQSGFLGLQSQAYLSSGLRWASWKCVLQYTVACALAKNILINGGFHCLGELYAGFLRSTCCRIELPAI